MALFCMLFVYCFNTITSNRLPAANRYYEGAYYLLVTKE